MATVMDDTAVITKHDRLTLDSAALERKLADLYAHEIGGDPKLEDRSYLRVHAVPPFVRDQVRTFEWYHSFLPASGTVLDWGCRHAPDSCLLRAAFGDRFDLHGCDFHDPIRYQAFHEFAQLQYTRIRKPLELPYDDESFDVVIGAGVLEHTALDFDSLRQLYRVLKPDGKLIIYYLPNSLSIQEWYQRVVRKQAFHRRLYRLSTMREDFKHFGFYPIDCAYQDIGFWERRLRIFGDGPRSRSISAWLARVAPLRFLCSTLRFVAVKVKTM